MNDATTLIIAGLSVTTFAGVLASIFLYSMLRESEQWNNARHKAYLELLEKFCKADEDRADWWRN